MFFLVTTVTTVTTVATVTTVNTVTTGIVKLLLYSSNGHFFTNVTNGPTDF